MKYQRQNRKSPSYFRHFEPPPRFQKENNFHNSPYLNSYWVFYLQNLKKKYFFFFVLFYRDLVDINIHHVHIFHHVLLV